MFACIFFEEDTSLSVVNQCDKSLEILTSFKLNEQVRMKWGRKLYNGTIIKLADNEEQLQKFASKANKAVLDGVSSDTKKEDILQLLLHFEIKKTVGKRQRMITEKLKESKEQEKEHSPKKKKMEVVQKAVKSKNLNMPIEETQENTTSSSISDFEIPGINLLRQFTDANLHTPVPSKPCDEPPLQTPVTSKPCDEPPLQTPVTSKLCDEPSTCSETTPLTTLNSVSGFSIDMWPQQSNILNNSSSKIVPETCSTHSIFSTPSVVLESPKPIPQQTQQAQTNLYNESVRMYRQAVDTLEENDTKEVTSKDVIKALQVLADPKFSAALQLVSSSAFQMFARHLSVHLQSEDCSHPCLEGLLSNTTITQGQGSFLSDLGESSTSFYHGLVSDSDVEKTSTPYKSSYQEQNLTQTTFDCNLERSEVNNCMAEVVVPITKENQVLIQNSPPRRTSPRKHRLTDSILTQQCIDQSSSTERRMSPRKQALASVESADQVKLLPTSNILVNRQALRKACHAATKKRENAAFHLMYNLMGQIFSIEEMAQSRGTGLGRPRPGEEFKPFLDSERLCALKEYVNSWCKKNVNCTFPDRKLNAAVTERTAYARKQMKKRLNEK